MNIKVGDLVEDCSLMVGVVMKIDDDDITIRRIDLDYDPYYDKDFSLCSLKHCGIVKLNAEEARMRIVLGKERLKKIWIDNMPKDYKEKVEEEYKKLEL